MGLRSFLLLVLALSAFAAHAVDVVVDADVFYYSDSFNYSSATSTYRRLFWDFAASLELSKKGRWALGWNYDSMSFDENPGTDTKLTVTDMGPKLSYALDKDRAWTLAFTYNLITKGSYSSGSSSAVELRGSSMRGDLAYTPMITDAFFAGLRLSYYKVSFNESVVNTTITKTTNSRTVIYPNIYLIYRFE